MIGAQFLLGVLSACAVLACEMPRVLAWPLALTAAGYGAWLAWREHRRLPREVLWPADDALVMLDGEPLQRAGLQWRGPLAFLRWRTFDGRSGHLSWWPDTLPAARRRELRLAAQRRQAARPAASMAP